MNNLPQSLTDKARLGAIIVLALTVLALSIVDDFSMDHHSHGPDVSTQSMHM